MRMSRRAFLYSSAAGVAGMLALSTRAQAQDRFDQSALMEFDAIGALTLIHVGDLHGQMMPHYSRPSEVNIGVGKAADQVPHLSGEAFRIRYGLGGGTPMDYAHTHENFDVLAEVYGKIGGLDRIATVVQAIRVARPDALFLTGRSQSAEGGPGHHPLLSASESILSALAPEMMARDTALLERGGTKIALIRTPARDAHLAWQIEDAQGQNAEIIICISQLGFDGDQALARDHPSIDVILSCASRSALPEPFVVGRTRIIASGTQGRFVSRVDLDVQDGVVLDVSHKLIPMFSDLIAPNSAIAGQIKAARAPFEEDLTEGVGQAATLLFSRGSLSSSWDDVICAALLAHHGAQIALSPGFGWGNTILPGQKITREDIYGLCGSAVARSYRVEMTGTEIKAMIEADAERRFHRDPGQRGNRELLRMGGVGFSLDVAGLKGQRISDMALLADQTGIEPDQKYIVAGWGRDSGVPLGEPLWKIVERFTRAQSPIGRQEISAVRLVAQK